MRDETINMEYEKGIHVGYDRALSEMITMLQKKQNEHREVLRRPGAFRILNIEPENLEKAVKDIERSRGEAP